MLINGHILFYGFNSEYILINQKESDSIKGFENLSKEANNLEEYKNNFNENYIVRIKDERIYGPFNKKDYIKTRKKLNLLELFKMNKSTLEFYTMIQRNDINYFKDLDADLIDTKNLKGNDFSFFFD